MCDAASGTGFDAALVAPRPALGDAIDPIGLEPVDEVVVTTLVDNVYDALLLTRHDRGWAPARPARPIVGTAGSRVARRPHLLRGPSEPASFRRLSSEVDAPALDVKRAALRRWTKVPNREVRQP